MLGYVISSPTSHKTGVTSHLKAIGKATKLGQLSQAGVKVAAITQHLVTYIITQSQCLNPLTIFHIIRSYSKGRPQKSMRHHFYQVRLRSQTSKLTLPVVRVAGVIEWSECHICPCLHVCRGCHEPKVILVYIH